MVLGLVGRNFAAGMSGGIAFVLDRENMFRSRCNPEMVALEDVDEPEDRMWLKSILKEFFDKTGSTLAESLLENWEESLRLFVKVAIN